MDENRILVSDSLSEAGLEVLRSAARVDVRTGLSRSELLACIGDYHALVVRSATRVTADVLAAGHRLRVVGRAGTGVDNIDVDAATRRGIMVVNAPEGNANAVAEHTIALLLALARKVYRAVASVKAGKWEKANLEGQEVRGKTLGLLGLGRIGMLVATKARGLEMRVVAHDPYVSPERIHSMGVELLPLDDLLRVADFVSIHTPLTDSTRGLLGAERLALLKPTAYLLNCARGGIVDEAALKDALRQGRLAGAALDVFSQEPATDRELVELPNVVATPHLGASTVEAQANVAVDVAHSVIDALAGRIPSGPVNIPYLPPQAAEFLRPYIDLAQRLGAFAVQWHHTLGGHIALTYDGELGDYDTRVLTNAFLAGLLAPISDEPVNIVNAAQLAAERGFSVSEMRGTREGRRGGLVTAAFPDAPERADVTGTVSEGMPRLLGLDGQRLDCALVGPLLVDLHRDRPGIVGRMGLILGEQGINIGFMQMSRAAPGTRQIMILGLDEAAPAALLPEFERVPDVERVRMVVLPPLGEG